MEVRYQGESSDDDTGISQLQKGKRHNFSFLQLGQKEMEEHLNNVFFGTDENFASVSENPTDAHALSFCNNQLSRLPKQLPLFDNLKNLDISSNNLSHIDDSILSLRNLACLIAKNNSLDDDSLPKEFGSMLSLKELNLSGNQFKTLPSQLLELDNLRFLYLGGNQIVSLPGSVRRLQKLQILYLGGNLLTEVPAEVGHLQKLEALILTENRLVSLPSSIAHLTKLHTLALQRNCLTTLPPEIVTLRGLRELSLRDNPLVGRFVRDMIYDPPSLLELAGRCLKTSNVPISREELPPNLIRYLQSAQRCVNPKCKGVYFDVCVQHIKFVDFCGRYRIPLLQYLCSPKCTASNDSCASDTDSSEDDYAVPASKLKKVLLG